MAKKNNIFITVDLEDWFQVENFKDHIPFSQWDKMEFRLEDNTGKLLRIFEKYKIKTTFFILGWNAERVPGLIREIHSQGHEIASHGYNHDLCSVVSANQIRDDIRNSKSILEDIIGTKVLGYRAPSFSITDKTISLLKEAGYIYDSSYNNFNLNNRYGRLNMTQLKKTTAAYQDQDGFWEFPISNLKIGNTVIPWGGGGYFRLLNNTLFRLGVKSILNKEKGYMFYIHPWEIDHKQPRVLEANYLARFRHYINIKKFEDKLSSFIESFQNCDFVTCSQYLRSIEDGQGYN